ncbi:MAG: hypothetical protein NXI24_22685 [bacterium]|nr:hypothetical protein [bacterium]
MQRVWRPEQFHYHHRLTKPGRRSVFEGWYFKIVDGQERRPHAIIPGVFLGADFHVIF